MVGRIGATAEGTVHHPQWPSNRAGTRGPGEWWAVGRIRKGSAAGLPGDDVKAAHLAYPAGADQTAGCGYSGTREDTEMEYVLGRAPPGARWRRHDRPAAQRGRNQPRLG